MDSHPGNLPDDIEALKAALIKERRGHIAKAADLALACAKAADDTATIAHQKLEIAKLKRQIYGPRSERTARLLEQMELELEELEATATEDEIAAEQARQRRRRLLPSRASAPLVSRSPRIFRASVESSPDLPPANAAAAHG